MSPAPVSYTHLDLYKRQEDLDADLILQGPAIVVGHIIGIADTSLAGEVDALHRLARLLHQSLEIDLLPPLRVVSVSYTHLDVYKRQAPTSNMHLLVDTLCFNIGVIALCIYDIISLRLI